MKNNYQTVLHNKRIKQAKILAYVLALNITMPVLATQHNTPGYHAQEITLSQKTKDMLVSLAEQTQKAGLSVPHNVSVVVEKIQTKRDISHDLATKTITDALKFIEKNLARFDTATALEATEVLSSYNNQHELRAGPVTTFVSPPTVSDTGYGIIENNPTLAGSTALGYGALGKQQASRNTAIGMESLSNLTAIGKIAEGTDNTAVGYQSLINNTIGINNIAIGSGAGKTITQGNNNIYVGSDAAVATENSTIRMGTPGTQKTCFIAGVDGVSVVGGSPVVINSNGQLGTGAGGSTNFDVTYSVTVGQNIYLPTSTDTQGVIYINGLPFISNGNDNSNAFVGQNAGNYTMGGDYCVGLGMNALQSNTDGNNNTAIGALTLSYNTVGYNNTAVGEYALGGNLNGHHNTGVGDYALYENESGDYNAAFGSKALHHNSVSYNSAFGTSALYTNNSGTENAALGAYALYSNHSGSYNTASGANALYSNSTGNNNTALGYSALNGNTASNNTAVGTNALQGSNTGEYNTALGQQVLYYNKSGGYNTAAGYNSMGSNQSGNLNSAYGYLSLGNNTSGNRNVAIGSLALVNNSTGEYNTAVGTNALFNNTTGTFNNVVGDYAAYANTTGEYNTIIGDRAFRLNKLGSHNTAVGERALYESTGSNNIGIGAYGTSGDSIVTGSNNICIGNSGASTDNATIKIGTEGTQTTCYIAGIYNVNVANETEQAVYVDSTGQLGMVPSSRRYKNDIAPLNKEVSLLEALNPVSFSYKNTTGRKHYGLVAEEVNEIFPELVARSNNGTIETVKYHELPALLLAGYKAQQTELRTQKEENQRLSRTLEAMLDRLATLEGSLKNNS